VTPWWYNHSFTSYNW